MRRIILQYFVGDVYWLTNATKDKRKKDIVIYLEKKTEIITSRTGKDYHL